MFLYHICRKEDKFNFSKGYIGVSKNSRTLKERWKVHRSGKKNRHLKHAYSKYNDIIEYIFIETTSDLALFIEEMLRPKEKMGWNIAKGGGKGPDVTGRKHTEQAKRKISEGRKGELHHSYGKKLSKERRDKVSKEWIVIDPNGNEIVVKNLKEFCKNNNLDSGNMMKVADGKRKQHKKYKCKRK